MQDRYKVSGNLLDVEKDCQADGYSIPVLSEGSARAWRALAPVRSKEPLSLPLRSFQCNSGSGPRVRIKPSIIIRSPGKA